jgi:NitT/TauT family transport system substrate-binding protein
MSIERRAHPPTPLESISRRSFLTGSSALAAAGALGLPRPAAAEPPPETTRLRIAQAPFICFAPQMLAEAFLRLEGFTEVQYVPVPADYTLVTMVGASKADLGIMGPTSVVAALDGQAPLVVLSGVHVGCWELFASRRVAALRDLKGKRIAVLSMRAVDQLWIASILAYVGIHPVTEVDWLQTGSLAESMRLFLEERADAFLAFPPQPQEMRMKRAGHVLVNTTLDRPWSQYFCCMAAMPREFVARHPVAAKRALRALLKATDVCATEPEAAARYLVAKGHEPRYEVALEVLKALPYNRWRETSPEDTLRFHALRLHEVGLIKSTPQKLIAQGTDWRFLNELKRELKT